MKQSKQIKPELGLLNLFFIFLQGKRKLGLRDLNQASLSILNMELIAEASLHGTSLEQDSDALKLQSTGKFMIPLPDTYFCHD